MSACQLGLSFAPPCDRERLGRQQRAVVELMQDGVWRTLSQIAEAVGAPEASVSARLRTARQSGWEVLRERVTSRGGLYRYKFRRPA